MADLGELTGVDPWDLLLGSIAMATLLAGLLTWPVCAVLLWRYRRAVDTGMRRRTGLSSESAAVSPADASPRPTGHHPGIRLVEVGPGAGRSPLLARAHRATRSVQLQCWLAGLLFGLASTTVYTVVEGLAWMPVRTLSLTLLLGWLVVPTVIVQAVLSRPVRLGLCLGYLALVVLLPVLGGASLGESLLLLVVVVGVPGLLILPTGVPALRSAAWLVIPALGLLCMAGLLLLPVVLHVYYGVALTWLMWSLLGSGVGLALLTVGYALTVGALSAHKWTSDRTLLVLQWWLVLALSQVLLLGTQGPRAAALAVLPFVVLVAVFAAPALLAPPSGAPPVRLLMLRTFGARRRSSQLLRDVTTQWRWVGSVELITGTDVATEVLEPHELLDFLRRRLGRHFVADVHQVEQRVQAVDLRPFRDGRFPVNDLLCNADTWQPTVQALVGDVDAVLLDLRGLTERNTGVPAELRHLVAVLPLHRVVALIDGTTDLRVLRSALDRSAVAAPDCSPLHDDPDPALRVVPLTGRRSTDVARVLSAVAAAAEHGPWDTRAGAPGSVPVRITG